MPYGGDGTFQDDIALLELVRGIKNWKSYSIDLVDSDACDFIGETVYISGWGVTEGKLHYANMPMQYAAIFKGCKNDFFLSLC